MIVFDPAYEYVILNNGYHAISTAPATEAQRLLLVNHRKTVVFCLPFFLRKSERSMYLAYTVGKDDTTYLVYVSKRTFQHLQRHEGTNIISLDDTAVIGILISWMLTANNEIAKSRQVVTEFINSQPYENKVAGIMSYITMFDFLNEKEKQDESKAW